MKKLLLFLLPLFFVGCTDELVQPDSAIVEKKPKAEGMQRVKVYSRDQLRSLVESLDESKVLSRSDYGSYLFTENEELFVSLAEANKQKVYSQLTAAQLREVENDPDGLEFEPSDEIIADMRFAQLLNADREIQIGDTVYRYITKGVVYTNVEHAPDLKKAELLTFNLDIPPASRGEGSPVQLSENLTFLPMDYSVQTYDDHDPWGPKGDDDEDSDTSNEGDGTEGPGDSSGSSGPSTGNGNTSTTKITLPNGITIDADDIREVNSDEKGDGNSFHRAINSAFHSQNVVATTKFSSTRKLTLNFYDQNYIIYSEIGSKLKMQKKVCGIWWNVKASKLIHGWETISLVYHMKQDFRPVNPTTQKVENPLCIQDKDFPIDHIFRVFLHVPIINYDIKRKDLYNAFKEGLNWVKKNYGYKINPNDQKDAGIYTVIEKDVYFTRAPFSQTEQDVRSLGINFYTKYNGISISFAYNFVSGWKFLNVEIPERKRVFLHSGTVYGAIQYNGRWRVAKIVKYPKEEK